LQPTAVTHVLPMRQQRPHAPQEQMQLQGGASPRLSPIRQQRPPPRTTVGPTMGQPWRQVPVQRMFQPPHQPQQGIYSQPPQPPQQSQTVVPIVQQQQQGNSILYGVEHIFHENGKDVSKMPILINGQTMWVETMPPSSQQDLNDGDSLMLPLDDDHPPLLQVQPPPQQQQQHEENKRKVVFSQEEMDEAVRKVVEDHISPTVVGREIGVTPGTVRQWVKRQGFELPQSYSNKSKVQKAAAQSGSGVQVQGALGVPVGGARPLAPSGAPTRPQLPRVATTPFQQFQAAPRSALPNGLTSLPAARPAGTSLLAPRPPQPVKAPTNQPHVPKYMRGYLAVCRYCGATSADFARCDACKKPIPAEGKRITDPNVKPQEVSQARWHCSLNTNPLALGIFYLVDGDLH